VKKPGKRSRRGHQYESLAEGYKILKSPLAASYGSAAEHYHAADPPDEPSNNSNDTNERKSEGHAAERP
jgi:hypothetical protein